MSLTRSQEKQDDRCFMTVLVEWGSGRGPDRKNGCRESGVRIRMKK